MDALTRIHQVRRTCCEMLQDRGYLVPEEVKAMSKEDFRLAYSDTPNRAELTMLCPYETDATRRIFVFFPEATKVGVKEIKDITEKMQGEGVDRAIMVVGDKLTPFAKGVIQDLSGKQVLEVFNEAELLVNITKHILVPKHRILSDTEKATLLARYKVQANQLPRIQYSDPVARYYGLQRGQVVRIVRSSETAGRYVTYRWCV